MESITQGIFDNLQFWHWWVLGFLLVILEVFSPGAFLMWLGVAAGVTGAALLVVPEMSWQIQFVVFAIASIAAILVGRQFFHRKAINTDDPTISQLESELIGKVFEVEKGIAHGNGRVKVGETTWKAQGPDCESGAKVRVVGVTGAILRVELA